MSKIIVDEIDSLSGGNITVNKKIEGVEPTADQELATKKYVDDNSLNPTNFYQKTDFIDSSAGVVDAGKPVVLDSAGQLDSSMVSVDSSLVDHTLVQNRGTNTHAQIDNHIADTSNPHSVTANQTGAFATSEFINSSSGIADAGKPVVLNASGELDGSMVTVNSSMVDHTLIQNIGTNSHSQIDSHISSTANPHSVTSAQVGAYNTSEFIDTTTGAGDAGKPIKTEAAGLVDNSFLPTATVTDAGIAEIATQAETNAGSDDERIVTALKINEAKQLQSFATLCSETGLNTTVNPGNSLNLLTLLTEANESLKKETYFDLKDTSNVTITNFLDETNDKFVFPSNLNTFNKTYKGYIIRVNCLVDFDGGANDTEEYNFRISRVIDNSIIDTRVLPRVELNNVNNNNRGVLFQTFVNGELDPYVLDGMYIDIDVPTNGRAITFNELSVLIQTI